MQKKESALAMLRLSCIDPSIRALDHVDYHDYRDISQGRVLNLVGLNLF